jgi:succinate-semialdehyde dehydrogenase/glutarate-semialdehyde dehydrogenase
MAIADAAKRSFRNAGQLCNSVNRIYVQEAVADEFAAKLATAAGLMRLGFGLDEPEPDLGPLSMASGLQRVEEHVEDARSRGGAILAGGARPDDERLAHGFFYPPTVVDHATEDMRMVSEETFGPVAPILRVATMDEAIERANSLEFGLVAYVYTKDLKLATSSSERLEFGTVNVNNVGGGDVPFPYGGWKQSGLGVELSHHGLEEYLAVKHVRLGIGY